MKKKKSLRQVFAIMLASSLLIATVSCDKEPVEDRPDLPPLESLVMDFSDFDEQPGGNKGTAATYENFLHSYLTVLFWNTASAVTLALPVASYAIALQQDAVYKGDNTWEWSFDVPFNNLTYVATLTGARISNEEFSMEMVLALSTAPNLGVKWFDGVVRYDHTHAQWNLFENGLTKVLEAEWNKDYETGEGDLTYTYVKPEHDETGSYISLSYMPGEFYDAAYSISLSAGMTDIEWNTTTIEGRVKAPVKFGDSDWHCWASATEGYMDITCP
jgi:hypothetical protein